MQFVHICSFQLQKVQKWKGLKKENSLEIPVLNRISLDRDCFVSLILRTKEIYGSDEK